MEKEWSEREKNEPVYSNHFLVLFYNFFLDKETISLIKEIGE